MVVSVVYKYNQVFQPKFYKFETLSKPSVLHQRPRVPFYEMGRKKVPCSHYVLRWNVLLVKMMVGKLEWLSHNGIDIGNCFIQQSYKRSRITTSYDFHLTFPFCKNHNCHHIHCNHTSFQKLFQNSPLFHLELRLKVWPKLLQSSEGD